MFYDSKTQLIQFTGQQKETKKVTRTIKRPDKKKLKMYWKVEIELSINDHTKSPKIYTLSKRLHLKSYTY